jgi:hypothetical protein
MQRDIIYGAVGCGIYSANRLDKIDSNPKLMNLKISELYKIANTHTHTHTQGKYDFHTCFYGDRKWGIVTSNPIGCLFTRYSHGGPAN